MNVLNFALRAATIYLDVDDISKMTAPHMILLADGLTAGLAEYWSLAPQWVTAPDETANLVTVANQPTVTLPGHFEKLRRAPRIRRTSSERWEPLRETVEPVDIETTGRPTQFRITDRMTDSPVWFESNNGNQRDEPALQLYPTPDGVYSLDVQCIYHAPRITDTYLSGKVNTINLPIPDHHLVTMVLPICARHFVNHPRRKKDDYPDVGKEWQRGIDAVRALSPSRTTTRRTVGTPTGF